MEVELELLKAKANCFDAERSLLEKREWVTHLPEPVQQKILGYQVVERIEYRDRVLSDNDLVRDGSTATKTELCQRYGFVTKNGTPDYKKLNRHLENLGLLDGRFWKNVPSLRDNIEFRREYLSELDRLFLNSDRQLNIGEK